MKKMKMQICRKKEQIKNAFVLDVLFVIVSVDINLKHTAVRG